MGESLDVAVIVAVGGAVPIVHEIGSVVELTDSLGGLLVTRRVIGTAKSA